MHVERDARTDRGFERALSGAGASGLLAIALLGPTGLAVAIVVFAVLIVAVGGATPRTARRGPIPRVRRTAADDRWLIWRHVEPEPEFLRSDGRRRRAA